MYFVWMARRNPNPYVSMHRPRNEANTKGVLHIAPKILQPAQHPSSSLYSILTNVQDYLTVNWLSAIQENHPDNSKVLLTQLYIGLLKTLFASIWEQQNSIAHSNESIVTKIEREKLIDELKEWKRSSGTRLASNQQFLINYHTGNLLDASYIERNSQPPCNYSIKFPQPYP